LHRRSIAPAVGGLALGYAAVTVVVAAGVGTLVSRSPASLAGLTLVGGTYLAWHGAMTIRHPSAPGVGGDYESTTSGWRTLVAGAGVSGLNPKGLLVLLALLPQFADPRWSWPVPIQISVLGLAFVVTCAAFYTCIGTFARSVLGARQTVARAVSRFSGAAMVALGGALVAERLLA
jgi:threonine/homoserine/homoserine lactone efflux protein